MWQAWLLCLFATAHAVVVHQYPSYAPDNKLQSQSFRTALYPQNLGQPQQHLNQPLVGFLQQYQPQPLFNQQTQPHKHEEFYEEPNYSFAYEIHDELTGDEKTHSENRQGNDVFGKYTVREPDGTIRIVEYTADEKNGFRAKVSHQLSAAKPIVAKPPSVVPNYIPRYTQPQRYQSGPVSFTPAKYHYSAAGLQPAPVTEQSKYAAVSVKPPLAYNPVVYASPTKEDKLRTPPGAFTNPNQNPYNPVQYA